MNKFLLLIFILIFCTNLSNAQKTVRISNNIYRVWVDTGGGTKRAYLATISDSAIYTSAKPVSFAPDMVNTILYTPINYTLLNKVRVRRKGSSEKGFFIGSLAGAAAGTLIGLISGEDTDNCFICFTAGEKALINGVLLGTIGGVTGAVIGLKEKKFKINYQRSNFEEFKQYMQSKVVYSTTKVK